MPKAAIRTLSIATAGGAALLAVLLPEPGFAQRAASAAAGPFGTFVGSWSGTGTVSLANGSNERIRCQAAYELGSDASNLLSSLRCASDSYKFELNSDVKDRGGTLSGAWREVSRNLTGNLSGSTAGGAINAKIQSPGFSADLTLTTRGERQTVALRSAGTELTGVDITLSRR